VLNRKELILRWRIATRQAARVLSKETEPLQDVVIDVRDIPDSE